MTIAGNLRRLAGHGAAFGRRNDGVSSLEFALVAPILFLGLLTMADLGFALFERMAMDHVLRAGAQKAIGGASEAEIMDILRKTAARNFVLANEVPEGDDVLRVTVSSYSACPENPDIVVKISTICAGPQPTSIFHELSAMKEYQGMLLPALALDQALHVQSR